MARFYGQVEGQAETRGTRRGNDCIKASVQSWNGSVIVDMNYSTNDKLMIRIQLSDDSDFYGTTYFIGTFEELKKRLSCEK